ncbi:hypothetical protein KUTeg_006725 [Tegillarca granosa]|uniref:Suppressor of forked domain-containing protein n=1 Tax=Tegillarca granosa TaxID=220873 RepID=A0ABQ9FE73_TEGGR|nr:hypothetical protein KUTeg_006725 [Tegillarca granosa]
MAQAYDFALDKMGMDIMSYNLWVDYINFLKAVEAVGSYAENQRITAVRKVYQRGVVNPMINIEALWKDYCAYETNINPLIAKKMTEDRGRDYMNARRVAKEYEAVTRGLNKNLPSVPPQNTPEEAQQVDLWKKYISWEKSNPLRTEDHALITKRVMFAYEQCLLCLGHHPDIWYEAASYLEQSSKILTEKGGRMKYEKVHNIYKRLIAVTDIDPTLGYVQYMKFARRAEGIKSARLVFKMAREDNRTKFQVFVAASLMEYYCSKEKTVALKIFELGLKKYGGIPEYVLCYMEFMSHLNEDNNTRVLYERVLSSGQIQPEKSIEIWSRFLAFESEVGDLASIQKVEKRRTQAIEKDLAKQRVVQLPGSEVSKVVYDEEEGKKAPEYPKPDVEQMLPFKPRQNTRNYRKGPFVTMDKFIEQMKNLVVPEGYTRQNITTRVSPFKSTIFIVIGQYTFSYPST